MFRNKLRYSKHLLTYSQKDLYIRRTKDKSKFPRLIYKFLGHNHLITSI